MNEKHKDAAQSATEQSDIKKRKRTFVLKEWHRTVLLLVLLTVAIGFIIWSNNQYQNNFIDAF